MKIWRVETFRGVGPYHSSYKTLLQKEVKDNFNESIHPSPRHDRYLERNLKYMGFDSFRHDPFKYGFRDIQQARDWFYKDKWIEDCQLKKFYLAEIEVESKDIAFGEKQVAFLYKNIKSKTRHNMKELLKYEPSTTY